jgi:hypothetical protein
MNAEPSIVQSQWILFTQQADLRIRDVEQITFTIHLLLAIDKCISIYTYYSVLIEGHLVLCNPLKQKPLL